MNKAGQDRTRQDKTTQRKSSWALARLAKALLTVPQTSVNDTIRHSMTAEYKTLYRRPLQNTANLTHAYDE